MKDFVRKDIANKRGNKKFNGMNNEALTPKAQKARDARKRAKKANKKRLKLSK